MGVAYIFSISEYFSLFTGGLCVVMAVGLLIRPPVKRNFLLAVIFLLLAYIQAMTILISTRLIYNYPWLYRTSLPLGYSLSPLIYLYIISFTVKKQTIRKAALLHFIPVLILSFVVLHYQMLPLSEKILRIDSFYNGRSSYSKGICFNIVIFMIYTLFIIIKLSRVYHRENPLHRRLIKIFLLFFSWIIILILRMFSMREWSESLWEADNFLFSMALLLFYFILQRYPILLSYAQMSEDKKEEKKSPGKNILDSVDIENLKINIEIMMDKEKLFCDEYLNLKRFSHALEISSHQLSAFLNEYYDRNFNSFINSYRIRFACSLLQKDPEMSILSAAFASGFNSYSAFFTAFKKETGQSPRQFRNRDSLS